VLRAGEEGLDGGGVQIGLFDVGDVRGLPKADELRLRDAFLDLNRAGLAELVAADGEERSLDFHPRAFGSGQCAQTLIHKAGVLVEQRGDDRYLLLVRPSFAAYVAEWLLDGMLGLKADAAA
jgi:hypothetical protein